VARDVRRLEALMSVNKLDQATDDVVKTAIKQGFKGK